MNKAFDNVIKKHIVLSVLTVFAVVLLASGVSYALFQIDVRNATNQTVSVGTLSADMTSVKGGIVVSDIYPESASSITDEKKKYEFTLTNTGTYDVKYEVYLLDATDALLSSSTEYSSYKRISESHYQYINYKLDGKSAKNLESVRKDRKFVVLSGVLKAGATEEHYIQFFLDNKDTTTSGAPNDIAGSVLSLDIYFEAGVETLQGIDAIIASSKGTITNFDSPASTTESAGVYELADEGGTSYYFRGPVENNYVRFGKWAAGTEHAGSDMYWRIVRVNGDGSLRLIYAGTSAHSNSDQGADTFIKTNQVFNVNYNDAKYVGYMYSPAGTTASTASSLANPNEESSTIKGVLESWYATNLEADYGKYISNDAIFCYDRSTPGNDETKWINDTGLGYGNNQTAYGATARTGVWNSGTTASAPTFVCPQPNDKFTSKNSTAEIGNKKLEYPIGLITADEIMAAGSGKFGTSSDYYLKRSLWYWSGSPYAHLSGIAHVFSVSINITGNLHYANVNYNLREAAVAPVISLSADYAKTLVGDGTIGNVYHGPKSN